MVLRLDSKSPVSTTDDGHHIVVDGRRWRATDPSIPDNLRSELVSELMAARRAVRDADDDAGTKAARGRVQNAKVALGERGHPWWEQPDESATRARISAAIFTMLGKRGHHSSVCPSEIARIVDGDAWRNRMDDVRSVARELARLGKVEVRQRGVVVSDVESVEGPIRIGAPSDPSLRVSR